MAKTTAAKIASAANTALWEISRTYHRAIPLTALFDAARPVGEPIQEDGTPWAGLLCGREGRASIELKGSKRALHIQWYRLPSGNYEINAYIA